MEKGKAKAALKAAIDDNKIRESHMLICHLMCIHTGMYILIQKSSQGCFEGCNRR